MNWIRCVAVNVEIHVTSVEPDDGVRLRGCVVHQHLRFLDGVGDGQSLLCADLVECNEHGGFDGARYLQKGAGDAFHARDAAFV